MDKTFEDEAKQVVKILCEEYGLKEFTAHQFIKTYSMGYTASYLNGLKEYHNVRQLHEYIGKYLQNNAATLGVKYLGKKESTTIFGKIGKVAYYEKL